MSWPLENAYNLAVDHVPDLIEQLLGHDVQLVGGTSPSE
jgi:hypothetical protein